MSMQRSYASLCVFLVFLHSFMLKVLAFYRHMYRSSSGSVEESDRNLRGNCSYRDDDQSLTKTGLDEKEGSVFSQSGLISNTSKYQFVSTETVSEYVKEPETAKLKVQEMFVGSNEVDLCEVDQRETSSEEIRQEFQFKFPLNSYSPSDEEIEGDRPIESPDIEELHLEKVKLDSDEIHSSATEVIDYVEDGMLPDQDLSYEVELNPTSQVSAFDVPNRVSDAPADSDDGDYIEFELHKLLLHEDKNVNQYEETGRNESQENRISWDDNDFDDHDDEEETDVLREHQDLVQQMKMELKNSRIKGLPTISEEHGSPKMLEDLKPFTIERTFEYKDAIDEIRKFYVIYSERMRKLDILNYQTLHAISFLELKEKEVIAARNKKTTSVLPRIWQFDTCKIYADSSQRSISEMQRELELIYVGQVCLSWEILGWLYTKAQELVEHDSKGNHSYNRVADDFQQFQVLLQRFMEEELFQGERTTCYVKRRCTIRNLLQVPMIKDDCYKDKKERTEETDAISLEILVNIIRESMMVFQDFLYSDKRATLKGVHGIKVNDAKESSNSRLLADTIDALHKKDKRVKESIRSQSCIIKKLKRQREECRSDSEIFIKSQVDLRLVSRVLGLPKITEDQILWCRMKLNSIGFVSRKVHVEPSFLLFPC